MLPSFAPLIIKMDKQNKKLEEKLGDITCPANMHGVFCFITGETPCKQEEKEKCITYLTLRTKEQHYGSGAVIDGGY